MKIIYIFPLIVITFISCYIDLNNADSGTDMTDDIVNIQKCAIRYRINPSASPLNSNSSLYFIAIGKNITGTERLSEKYDPSQEILNSLQSEFYNVKKVSDGKIVFDETHNAIYDKVTGEQGVLMTVGETINKKINDTTAAIYVDIFLGALFEEGYSYTVKYDNGLWQVVRVDLTWISK